MDTAGEAVVTAIGSVALMLNTVGQRDDLDPLLRARLAKLMGDAVSDAYRSGEVDFLQALAVVDKAAAGSGRERRIEVLGEMAIRLLELGEPKYLGRSRPVYPEWLKNLAVTLVDSMREDDSWGFDFDTGVGGTMPAQTARLHVTDLLARLQLTPREISERTLRDWCLERHRARGTPARRGRPRKK